METYWKHLDNQRQPGVQFHAKWMIPFTHELPIYGLGHMSATVRFPDFLVALVQLDVFLTFVPASVCVTVLPPSADVLLW